MSSYVASDNIKGINIEKIYYRLKTIDNSGKYSYSNVIIVSLTKLKTTTNTCPNPFTSQVNIQISTDKKGTAAIVH